MDIILIMPDPTMDRSEGTAHGFIQCKQEGVHPHFSAHSTSISSKVYMSRMYLNTFASNVRLFSSL